MAAKASVQAQTPVQSSPARVTSLAPLCPEFWGPPHYGWGRAAQAQQPPWLWGWLRCASPGSLRLNGSRGFKKRLPGNAGSPRAALVPASRPPPICGCARPPRRSPPQYWVLSFVENAPRCRLAGLCWTLHPFPSPPLCSCAECPSSQKLVPASRVRASPVPAGASGSGYVALSWPHRVCWPGRRRKARWGTAPSKAVKGSATVPQGLGPLQRL